MLKTSLTSEKTNLHSIAVLYLMSKTLRTISLIFAASVQILHFFNNSNGQNIEVNIKISTDSPVSAEITGKYISQKPRTNARNISFLDQYAGAGGLADRISNLELADRDGHQVAKQRFNAGEYVADADFGAWKYNVNLPPPEPPLTTAHVSWLTADTGLLMLDDLLPQSGGAKIAAKIKIYVPAGWKILTAERSVGTNEFDVTDVEKASFVIGRNWREKEISRNGFHLHLLISGDWRFSDEDALKIAGEIFDNYLKIFGSAPNLNSQIAIMKFPGSVASGNWEADTRGTSITINSSDMPFRSQSVQRLHEQLRHEIFHLWLPEGVNFSGHYDWFYEGFALYQSLKIGVAANRIRFDDYLDTLSRAYNIDSIRTPRLSLREASKNRWSGAISPVYPRGLLVAFLCDLALLEKSKGKTSTENLVREIYQKYHLATTRTDGNTAVIDAMRLHPELRPIAERYINGPDKIDWSEALAPAGIEAVTENSVTTLKIVAKPSGRQKDLLDKLGYNNWRKLTVNNR